MALANFWYGALQRIEHSVAQVWSQEPLFLVSLVLMILVAVIQAALLRRTQKRLCKVSSDLTGTRDELTELGGKYEREVHWRQAAERVAADKGTLQVPSRRERGNQDLATSHQP